MINVKTIDDLAQRLSAMVPPGASAAREELADNFRAALRSGLSRLDLVSRDEFDIQRAVLLRTREKIDLLERMVADLEQRLDELNTDSSAKR
ncbi:MAG: accessory factor UbiK family protein [Lysobacteraceae bacterium]